MVNGVGCTLPLQHACWRCPWPQRSVCPRYLDCMSSQQGPVPHRLFWPITQIFRKFLAKGTSVIPRAAAEGTMYSGYKVGWVDQSETALGAEMLHTATRAIWSKIIRWQVLFTLCCIFCILILFLCLASPTRSTQMERLSMPISWLTMRRGTVYPSGKMLRRMLSASASWTAWLLSSIWVSSRSTYARQS